MVPMIFWDNIVHVTIVINDQSERYGLLGMKPCFDFDMSTENI